MALGMLSLLAGLGQGYNDGAQQKLDNERRKDLDQIALQRAARDATDFDQQQADRAELRAAGAQIVATPDMVTDAAGATSQRMLKPDTMDNADVGQPGEAPVNIGAQRVGMQGMQTPDQANALVTKANSPDAMRARQLAVLQKQSPEKAALLQAHDMSLKNTQMDLANKEFDSAANAAASKGWDAFGEFMNNSQSSEAKGKWVASADGKTMQAYRADATGALTPSGLIFENTPKGLAEAATFVSKQVPVTAKLKHYMDEKEANRKEGHDLATERYQGRMATVAEQNADTNESYRKDMGAAAGARAANVGSGAGRKADHFDEKQWDAASKIEPSFVSFGDDMGGKPVESPELRLTYRSELNNLRAAGNSSPSEAAEAARTTTLMLKNEAANMVAADRQKAKDSSMFNRYTSTLTEVEAVRQILKAYSASQKKATPAATATAPAAAPATSMQRATAAAPPATSAPAVAPPAAPPAASAAPAGFKPQPTGDASMNRIDAENIASMKPLNDAVELAKSQLAATAKSGDPQALSRYAAALTAARAAREKAAQDKFGNRAAQYLASVGA